MSRFSPRLSVGKILVLLLVIIALVSAYNVWRPLPPGVSYKGAFQDARDVKFLADITYVDAAGERHMEQAIFDEIFRLIKTAERFVLVDMFLFNPFQGPDAETHRQLSIELTQHLIQQKQRHPSLQVLVVTDPFNTLYGGIKAQHLEDLEAAGISVTYTALPRLRDSNPLYSGFWRIFLQPWGNGPGDLLPNPVAEGRVSLRSYLSLLNFKANHRKVIIADEGEHLVGIVTSANPHDGSSAHSNVALRFSGPAVADLLDSERAVLALSGGPAPQVAVQRATTSPASNGSASGSENAEALKLQVLTERAVETALLNLINAAGPGDYIDVASFYLSDRHLVTGLVGAHQRGAKLRVLLDPNKDAFGRTKNGVPNRPVAHELHTAGIPVRWCDTHGEQCHAKFLQAHYSNGESQMLLGSANFTRRNLHNLNLESSVLLLGTPSDKPLQDAAEWFDMQWNNTADKRFSTSYETYADDGLWHRAMYRFMEATGLSTF